ncbi:MAG: hypothetical protein DDT27_00565 [Dehalococcoidia bacterium]|nr:hypothetical protein [Chloroflexota bacterium]
MGEIHVKDILKESCCFPVGKAEMAHVATDRPNLSSNSILCRYLILPGINDLFTALTIAIMESTTGDPFPYLDILCHMLVEGVRITLDLTATVIALFRIDINKF